MLRTAFTILFLSLTILTAFLPVQPLQASELESVSLQLDWKFQFEYAGFIIAKEKGFYEAEGLDVTLLEYQPGVDTVADVLSQQTNYGIHNSSLVISNKKIEPTVLLATYFQHSPLVFITQKNITSPSELVGKTIMGTTDELKYSSLALTLKHFGINNENSTIIEHSFNIQDFIDGKVDAMSGFLSNQIFELNKRGINYNIIHPAQYGFFMSAVNLFTSKDEVRQHPQRAQRFLKASNAGWEYALDHPTETIQLIHDHYAPDKSIEALTFEATITEEMFVRGLYPVGAVNGELTKRTYKQLLMHQIIDEDEHPTPFLLDELIDNRRTWTGFSDEEIDYLLKKEKITMCVDPNWMPFEEIKDDIHYGIAADYMTLFQQKLPVPIELVKTASWTESIIKAQRRECDIYSLAASTPARRKYMDFTTPYITLPVVIATTNDKIYIESVEDILTEKIGIVQGYAIAEALRFKYPHANIVEVASITDGLQKVESGELYCYIDNLMVIAEQIQKQFTGTIKVSGRIKDEVKLAIGTRNDEPLLNSIFHKLIPTVAPDEKQAIYNRWVSVNQEMAFDYHLFWTLFGVFALISGFYAVHFHQLNKYNRMLLKLSETDKLTDLYNRCKLDELLLEKEQLFYRYQTACGVAILDIDHFKQINDSYGHQTGDSVLIELSKLMTESLRTTDVIGRWGGEEFLIIAPNSDTQETTIMAEKMLERIRSHRFQKIGALTASCGVCSFNDGKDIQNTIRLADEALYKAKSLGRDQVVTLP
ncbi:MAG: diguanylate cyclase [Desulfuromonadales bacterium C00003068]|jgi:diguanylate cyclase (GGDEF)-like protein|nr:MAG: diguanylate cyclase [Desulfuromonadales bacterium C00003068]